MFLAVSERGGEVMGQTARGYGRRRGRRSRPGGEVGSKQEKVSTEAVDRTARGRWWTKGAEKWTERRDVGGEREEYLYRSGRPNGERLVVNEGDGEVSRAARGWWWKEGTEKWTGRREIGGEREEYLYRSGRPDGERLVINEGGSISAEAVNPTARVGGERGSRKSSAS